VLEFQMRGVGFALPAAWRNHPQNPLFFLFGCIFKIKHGEDYCTINVKEEVEAIRLLKPMDVAPTHC
jgi:hypothetical protein